MYAANESPGQQEAGHLATMKGIMRVLGVEFVASNMIYVLLEKSESGLVVKQKNRLALGETRSSEALIAFRQAVQTTLNDNLPDRIAIKLKPEKGVLQAGAAAIKMEGIVLASAPCPVDFVSGARINKCAAVDSSLAAYFHPAYKAGVIVIESA